MNDPAPGFAPDPGGDASIPLFEENESPRACAAERDDEVAAPPAREPNGLLRAASTPAREAVRGRASAP